MNNHSTVDEKSKKLPSWAVLSLRWLIGGVIGFGLSAWICLGMITNTVTGPLLWFLRSLPFIGILFGGPLILFDNSFFGTKYLIEFLSRSFPNIDRDFLVISLPSIIWGIIGALLASGRKEQMKAGFILLVLYVLVGFYALFRGFLMIPT